MKTVLAPNAPWPYKSEPPKVKPAPKAPKPPRPRSKIGNTDDKFKAWAEKNL